MFYISFIFMSAFPHREGHKGNSRRIGILHSQQQFQIVLLAPHQDGTKQVWICSHSTLVLYVFWAAFQKTCLASLSRGILGT